MHEQEQNNLAFVFPGQGSQSVGMMDRLADSYPLVEKTFAQASEVLDMDLWALVSNGPEATLNQTCYTQPAMLAAGIAVWRIWCEQSAVRPAWVAGHSLGEYTALVCAGVITFEDAIALVSTRGRLMQDAIPEGVGAMAAILGLEDHIVVKVCASVCGDEVVAAVNFNAPGQVVIAGHVAAVERAMEAAKQAGAKRAVKLPVSVPSHCALMLPAAEKMAETLLKIPFGMPSITLVHNVDVNAHSAPEVIRSSLKEQLYKPVRWTDSIKFMHEQGVTTFVECGPGKVLLGLNKRIAKDADHLAIFDSESLAKVMEYFNE